MRIALYHPHECSSVSIAPRRASGSCAVAAFAFGASVLLTACGPTGNDLPSAGGAEPSLLSASAVPVGTHPSHVFVVIFENEAADAALGPEAPYLASLAARYGNATNYTATTHPSQPNYLELFSGSTQGVTDDKSHELTGPSLADQLDGAGFTWRLYAENFPGTCFTGAGSLDGADGKGDYRRKHNPAISFTAISGNPARCANITDFSQFDPAASDVAFIIPNLCHDMHDCPIAAGDAWARRFLAPLIASPAMRDGVLFVTWDEAHGDSANHIATIVVSPRLAAPVTSARPYGHASLLRTIEELYGLPCLADACRTEPMSDLLPAG
jgi:phosphatidylinositol-3-phosphatase